MANLGRGRGDPLSFNSDVANVSTQCAIAGEVFGPLVLVYVCGKVSGEHLVVDRLMAVIDFVTCSQCQPLLQLAVHGPVTLHRDTDDNVLSLIWRLSVKNLDQIIHSLLKAQ